MSGSIKADRINRNRVQDTVDWFKETILQGFEGYVSAIITGSFNSNKSKKDYGDIDLVIQVDGKDLTEIRKRFQEYIKSLPDNLTVPFKGGKNKGKKVQQYAQVVICQIPIQGFEGLTVQVDCNFALSEKEQEFQKNYLDQPAEKLALIRGLVSVILQEEDPIKLFKRLHITKVPKLESNQAFEFHLSHKGLTLRKITLENFEEKDSEDVWKSRDWSDVEVLLRGYGISQDFDGLLGEISSKLKKARSKRKMLATVQDMVKIPDSEKGTAKGDQKERALEKAEDKLAVGVAQDVDPKNVIALYGGGFKPVHKGYFSSAEKLAKKADRLIIFISPKVREGVPVTADQAKDIWQIYSKYYNIPVEVRVSQESPVQDILKIVNDEDHNDTNFIIGVDKTKEDKEAYQELKEKPNVTLEVLPTEDDSNLVASTLRQSVDIIKKGNWIPKALDRDDARKVLDILLKPLQQEIVKEETEKAVAKVLSEIAGRPIDENLEIRRKFRSEVQDAVQVAKDCIEKFNDRVVGVSKGIDAYDGKYGYSGNVPWPVPEQEIKTVWGPNIVANVTGLGKVIVHSRSDNDSEFPRDEDSILKNNEYLLAKKSEMISWFRERGYDANWTAVKRPEETWLSFYPRTQTVEDTVRKTEKYMYHASPKFNDEYIREHGFTPNSEGVYGSNRIYFALGSISEYALDFLIRGLRDAGRSSRAKEQGRLKKDFDQFIVYKIDISKVPPMEMFIDPEDANDNFIFVEQTVPYSAVVGTKLVNMTGKKSYSPLEEGSSGTHIMPTSVISSENREKLAKLYEKLQADYGDYFDINFNQSFIQIKVKWPGELQYGRNGFDYEMSQAQQFTEGQEPDAGLQESDKAYWIRHMAGLIEFMRKKGLKLDPLPEIILKKQDQDLGLLDKTGSYDKDNNVIEIYTGGRHVKDCLRSLAHELVHSEQNREGKLVGYRGDQISEDQNLLKLEEEATLKGYTLFREYTESLKK